MNSQDNSPLTAIASKRPNLVLGPDDILGKSDFINPKHHSGAAAIIENGKLIGIFTERDLLKRVLSRDLDLDTIKFREVMTGNPVTVSADSSLPDALDIITKSGFRYLPVMKEEIFVGMIDVRDLYEAMNALIKEAMDTQSQIFSDMMREPYGYGA